MSLNLNSRFDIILMMAGRRCLFINVRKGCPLPQRRAARDADRPATLPEPTVRRRMRCGQLRLQRPLCRSRRCRNDEQRREGSRRLLSSVAAAIRGNVRMDESLEDRLFVRVWLPCQLFLPSIRNKKCTTSKCSTRFDPSFRPLRNCDRFLGRRALDCCWQPHAHSMQCRLAQAASNHWCKVLHI